MKPTPQAIENAARKICQSGKFETGQGTCAVLCMDQLGDVRKKGCGHCVRVHSKLARDVLSADLGDMVLVPKEAVTYARQMANICFNLKQSSALDFSTRKAMDETQSGFDRAMLAATEDSNDQG